MDWESTPSNKIAGKPLKLRSDARGAERSFAERPAINRNSFARPLIGFSALRGANNLRLLGLRSVVAIIGHGAGLRLRPRALAYQWAGRQRLLR